MVLLGFWDEYFWLPENITWNDLKSNSTHQYPEAWDLRYTIYLGAVMLITRILIESFIFLPIGYMTGWINKSDGALVNRIWNHLNFGFCGKSKFKRVSESGWRCLMFVILWIMGAFVLYDEPQLYDVDECWRNWPYHPISNDVWWYYIFETGFYWALFFSTLVFDIRRSDFLQMMAHHAITITLLWLSWSVNFVRVGALILFSHDAADVFIELGKQLRYADWDTALTVDFLVMMTFWIATRLVYYPFWIISSVLFRAPKLIQETYRWENFWQRPIVPRIFVAMLVLLVGLHVFWTYILLKIAYKAASGKEIDDEREDSDSEEEVAKKKEDKKEE